MGPYVKKLVARRMSTQMIPDGGDVLDCFNALTGGDLPALARKAHTWVKEAIAVVKTAPDNPYGDDDEAIAEVILEKLR